MFLPPSALRVASITLRNPANRNRVVALNAKQFRYGFGNAVSEAESNELYERWAIPSPGKPLFEAALANFAALAGEGEHRQCDEGPAADHRRSRDHTVPATISKQTLKLYRKSPAVTELKEFPDRGHSLALDSGWRDVADAALAWLKSHSL